MAPPLDIAKTIADLQSMYAASPGANKINFILYGEMGCGKTTMAIETCRKPCLVHSFDPGGCDSVDPKLIASGQVIVDNRFERDEPKRPKAFAAWDAEFERLLNGGFFNNIGTFVLDSITTWSSAAMYAVLAKSGRAAGIPRPAGRRDPLVRLVRPFRDEDTLDQRVLRGPDPPVRDQHHPHPEAAGDRLGLGLHRAGIGIDVNRHFGVAKSWTQ